MRNLTTFTQTPEGLLIELNRDEQEEIDELRDKLENDPKANYHGIFWELCESPRCNGYSMVPDEYKGLTDAPIIADGIIDEETTKEDFENTQMWCFTDYMIRDELRELFDKGFVLFPKIQ